jgi:hypothetical protein
VSEFLCVCVVLCVGRGLGAGLIPRPRSPTKCLKGSLSKKKNPTPRKGVRKMRKKKKKKKNEPVSYWMPDLKLKIPLSYDTVGMCR